MWVHRSGDFRNLRAAIGKSRLGKCRTIPAIYRPHRLTTSLHQLPLPFEARGQEVDKDRTRTQTRKQTETLTTRHSTPLHLPQCASDGAWCASRATSATAARSSATGSRATTWATRRARSALCGACSAAWTTRTTFACAGVVGKPCLQQYFRRRPLPTRQQLPFDAHCGTKASAKATNLHRPLVWV